MKHTTQSYYSGYPQLETSGWTIVYQGNEPASPDGWRNFSFQTPFEYNGTDNLLVDYSFNNSSSSTNGVCFVSDTGATRVILAMSDSQHGDPLSWDSYTLGISIASAVPNLKLISTIPANILAGDFNSSCSVNLPDFAIFSAAWLSTPLDGNWDQQCDIAPPLDIINILDLEMVVDNWLVITE